MLLNLCFLGSVNGTTIKENFIQSRFFSVSHLHSQSISKSSLLFLQNTEPLCSLGSIFSNPTVVQTTITLASAIEIACSLSLLTLTTFPR